MALRDSIAQSGVPASTAIVIGDAIDAAGSSAGEKVSKTGDAMTGSLAISGATPVVSVAQSTVGVTETTAAGIFETTDAGAAGPCVVLYHNSASPAIGDLTRMLRSYRKNDEGTAYFDVQIGAYAEAIAAGSESAQLLLTLRRAGAVTQEAAVGGGLSLGAAGATAGTGYLMAMGSQAKAVAVSALPVAASGLAGLRATVNDSNTALTAGIGAIVANGGANVVPVFCDGTNWRIG